jgi:two-component system chemotaxis response regulator CheB
MDMMLPFIDGLAATEYIMAYFPTPILVVSASVNRGEIFRTYDALAAGAVDVLDKPGTLQSNDEWEIRFIATVKLVSKINVITHPRGRLRSDLASTVQDGASQEVITASELRLIALGASTGGPAAIAEILKSLPANFPIPILVVIHIAEMFSFALADWLSMQTKINVRYATDGEALPTFGTSQVLLAPPNRHLVLRAGKLRLTNDPMRHSCRPSVDVLFQSIAVEMGPRALLCLLTGMGRDGAAGLLSARRAGAFTIAQDEKSSVVFGMPAEAIKMGGAQRVLPLESIATAISSLALGSPTKERL